MCLSRFSELSGSSLPLLGISANIFAVLSKSKHPLYNIWRGMHYRCSNPNARYWKRYGGRGIKVCQEWSDFYQFVSDIGPRPSLKHSLDRIDNEGDYTPKNCRWATRKEQQRNQSVTRWVSIQGKRYKACDLSEISGLKTDSIIERAALGLTYDQVVDPKKRIYLPGLALGGSANGKKQRQKTHCPKGHSYEDAIITRQGWRRCRQCFYEKERRRLVRRKCNP